MLLLAVHFFSIAPPWLGIGPSFFNSQKTHGLHVGIAMFTCYLMGYFTFRALFNHNPAMSAAGGILGLVIAMLVETLLFIIRTSSLDKKPARKATSTQKKNQ
uniref:Uncharacterized protein n=1 Tax=Solanum lycopersicum TaxID=4081 RepID=A0A3Q7HTT8_SOLLC